MARSRYNGGVWGRARARRFEARTFRIERDYLYITVHLYPASYRCKSYYFGEFKTAIFSTDNIDVVIFASPRRIYSSGKTHVAVRRAVTAQGWLQRNPKGIIVGELNITGHMRHPRLSSRIEIKPSRLTSISN